MRVGPDLVYVPPPPRASKASGPTPRLSACAPRGDNEWHGGKDSCHARNWRAAWSGVVSGGGTSIALGWELSDDGVSSRWNVSIFTSEIPGSPDVNCECTWIIRGV